MGISQKDIKLLWGRSGNRCAICKQELNGDKDTLSSILNQGEQARIVGAKEDEARGKSRLSQQERNSYHNLILLCPADHSNIDNNVVEWPIEKLHQIKSEHELWVIETLSETVDHVKLAHNTILAGIVDQAVNLCSLEQWHAWTSYAMSSDPLWPKELPNNIFKFRQKVVAAIWPPEFDELKKATITFSVLINRAAKIFMKHSDLQGDTYFPFKFYKHAKKNSNYNKDLKRYKKWQKSCFLSLYEATKAANWFADVVRKQINPMFFALEGKFLIEEGPNKDLIWSTRLLEFTEEDKANYPEKLFKI
ncbi:MAG: hypothetical protein QM479_02270 [Pseudomonadota bacterium]